MKFSNKVASTQEASEKEDVTETLRKKTETINQSINQNNIEKRISYTKRGCGGGGGGGEERK